jgi:hypothetical protein
MDLLDVIGFGLPTFGITVGTAAWLAKRLVDHRLKEDLQIQRAGFEAKLAEASARWEGAVKKEVETYLADRAADRQYELDARKRLYSAIGPLRFQLLMACRDLAGRVVAHAKNPYATSIESYYGRSLLFRILRPLALCELIERQIAYADFSVDSGAVDLLRFKKGAYAALSGGNLVAGHPLINWTDEVQHVFFDHISRAAAALITSDGPNSYRVIRFDEFSRSVEIPSGRAALQPFPELFANFSPAVKPILWLRLVGLAFLCNEFINRGGKEIGFQERTIECRELLTESKDLDIVKKINVYASRCAELPLTPL